MKFCKYNLVALLFGVLLMGCLIALSSCDELINNAKQLIPDAGSQYNAAEELKRAQGDTTIPHRPYIPKNENTTDYGKYTVKWEVTPNAILWTAYDGETKKVEGSIHLDENPSKIKGLISDENGTKTVNVGELIEEVKKLIPDPGSQYNAAEELRWAQGKSDKIRPYAPNGANNPNTAYRGTYYSCNWNSAPNATQYCVNWSLHKNGSKITEGTSDWIDKLEYKWLLPNETGVMYVNVYAKNSGGQSQDPLAFEVTVMNKGKLIFFTHGLNSDIDCFKKTVNALKSNKYFLAEVTMKGSGTKPKIIVPNNILDIKKFIEEKVGKEVNVLIRTEFSDNNLSFDEQFSQLDLMVKKFEIDYTNVIFIGHSMGGLISINQGMTYADRKKNQRINVTVITVSTPYQPNNYAKVVWQKEEPGFFTGLISNFAAWLAEQQRGFAHRDLGGFADDEGKYALSELKNKWNNYTGNVMLYAISVSMYSKSELRWKAIGDGMVDIPAQQGDFLKNLNNVGKWNKVKKQETIFGTGKSAIIDLKDLENITEILNGNYLAWLEAGGMNDKKKPGYHKNTPYMPKVIGDIKIIIEE